MRLRRTGHQRLALDLAPHDAVEDHYQHRNADGDVLKGLFGDGTAVLQMRQAQHDRQNAEGDQNRVNQTLLVGHNGFLNAHEPATDAACLRAYLTPMRNGWHRHPTYHSPAHSFRYVLSTTLIIVMPRCALPCKTPML
ncbi:hypothetical protein ALQ91_102038 [Pseudomonas syringae pv. syringae]|nr:hypothetical protein ALQ91_102038 [Pseudomonas syringae pv. syringae]